MLANFEQRAIHILTRTAAPVVAARRKIATIAVLLLAVVVGYHVMFGENGMLVYQKKRAEYRILQKDVDRLQKENQALSDQIKSLKSDPKAIEKEAREQLRYARPGEVIYLLPGQKPADRPPVNATAEKH